MQVHITGKVADSAAVPVNGRIEFSQAQRFDNGELQVTGTVTVAQVVAGELRTAAGDTFSLPSNPEGTAVRIREVLGGSTFEWWAAVPEEPAVEYRMLPLVESEQVPASVWGPPPWLADVEQMRDQTLAALEEGNQVAESLGGLAGIQQLISDASAEADRSAASAVESAASAASAGTLAGDASASADRAEVEAGKAAAAAGSAAADAAAGVIQETAAQVDLAKAQADRAKTEADRAEAVANSIDMSAINTRLDGVDSTLTEVQTDLAAKASKQYIDDLVAGLSVNVMNFGAVADGVTDNTSAFQAAVDSIDRGTILVPPGEYLVSGYVKLKSNISLMGAGAVLRKPRAADRVDGSFFAILSDGRTGYGAGAENVSFFGFTIWGFAEFQESVCLLAANHGRGITVSNVTAYMAVARGHILDLCGSDSVVVDSCRFLGAADMGGGTAGEAIQSDISASGSVSVADDPASYDGLPARNIHVRNCIFDTYVHRGIAYPAPVAFGVHTSPTGGAYYEDMKFTDNYVGATQTKTSGVMGAVHFLSAKNVLIDGNTFHGGNVDNPQVSIQAGFGAGGTTESRGIVISNNHFQYGAAIQLRFSAGVGISISGNTFDSYGVTQNSDGAHAIQIGTGPDAFSITGNTFNSYNGAHANSMAVFATAGSVNQGVCVGNIAIGKAAVFGGAGFTASTNRRIISSNNIARK